MINRKTKLVYDLQTLRPESAELDTIIEAFVKAIRAVPYHALMHIFVESEENE